MDRRWRRLAQASLLSSLAAGCGEVKVAELSLSSGAGHAPEAVQTGVPILFVTQVPIPSDFTTIASAFGNHLPDTGACGRGGDLWIRYPQGRLKNLTKEA